MQCSIFHNHLRTFAPSQVLFDIFLLTWEAKWWRLFKLWIPYILFEIIFVTLFGNGHFYQSCKTRRWKWQIVSTFSNFVYINVEIHNDDSTLFDIANSNVETHNIVATLIWRCPISGRRINQKTTLKQRWNVYWEPVTLRIQE